MKQQFLLPKGVLQSLISRRRFLQSSGVLGAVILDDYKYQTPTPLASTPTQSLSSANLVAQIEGYSSATSVQAGDSIGFHIFVKAKGIRTKDFKIDIFRQGIERSLVHSDIGRALLNLEHHPVNCYEYGCNWPEAYSLSIPQNWESGLYIARFSIPQNSATTEIPFVVRSATPGARAKILMSLNFVTYQAYNFWGGRGLYGCLDKTGSVVDDIARRAVKVSFDRPFLTGSLKGNFYNLRELPFMQWMEKNGFEVEYCTSIDLHADENLLAPYKLLVIVGHEEYWSRDMRAHVEGYIANGGNVAFFAGNTCWWQVRLEDNNRTLVCYKDTDYIPSTSEDPMRPYQWPWPVEYKKPLTRKDNQPLSSADVVPGIYDSDAGLVTSNWKDVPWGLPDEEREYENSMTGVSFEFGAGWWNDPQPPTTSYVARNTSDPGLAWVFQDTGLNDGDEFGIISKPDGTQISVVSAECDGVEFPADETRKALERDFRPAGAPHTPSSLKILAAADLSDWWQHGGGAMMERAWANMIVYTDNGTVFNAGTTDWAFGLSLNSNWNSVDQITKNVLEHLSEPT